MKKVITSTCVFVGVLIFISCATTKPAVVFQSDFGRKNHAVASMYGVAKNVNNALPLYDLTHEIPEYDIWIAALTLAGTIEYWPKNTVFVSIVDPGVGTNRTSVVAKTKTGHYIVTPDNGTLTFVQEQFGIEELREIEEAVNRRKDSEKSYTFHGRDVYAYTAARLASGAISFEQVGQKLERPAVSLSYTKSSKVSANVFEGTITMIDEPYGNIWTNINRDLFLSDGIKVGDTISVKIWDSEKIIYTGTMPYVETFGSVLDGQPLAYINSVYQVSLALNMSDFARTHKVNYGWKIEVSKK